MWVLLQLVKINTTNVGMCVQKRDIFKRKNQTIFIFNIFFTVFTVYLNPQAALFIYVEIFE